MLRNEHETDDLDACRVRFLQEIAHGNTAVSDELVQSIERLSGGTPTVLDGLAKSLVDQAEGQEFLRSGRGLEVLCNIRSRVFVTFLQERAESPLAQLDAFYWTTAEALRRYKEAHSL